MATVTALTAARMLEIENESVVDGDVVGDSLILTKHDGSTINAGNVRGPAGPAGPPASANSITEAMLVAGNTGLIKGAFRVWLSFPTSVSRGYYIHFNRENHDYSDAIDSGIFTAPIKGLYHFDWGAEIGTVLPANSWVQANLGMYPSG